MEQNESIEYCKNIVRSFLFEYCDNNLDKLLDFDIDQLEHDIKFGKPPEYKETWVMDPDDSVVARSILYLLYFKKIDGLTYDMIGTRFRGDTLFTPGNIFGKQLQYLGKQDIDNKILSMENTNKFLKEYHTIPNMILLPNEKIEIIRDNNISYESLNQYRGMNRPGMSDYIDVFLIDICNCIEKKHPQQCDEYISLLFQKNAFYFNLFDKGIDFLRSHFLEDVICENDNSYNIIEQYQFKHLVWWRKHADFKNEAEKFLKAFYRLRTYRKKKMMCELENILFWTHRII